jgi:type IV pilus assembly protein PilV
MNRNKKQLSQHQNGASLIEILASIAILAIGLLGIAALQMVSLKNTHSSGLHTQATISASDILDRMRLNRTGALAGDYDIAINTAAPVENTVTSDDLIGWKSSLTTRLPTGDGAIDCSTVTGLCVVTVQWDDRRATAGSSTAQVVLRGRL